MKSAWMAIPLAAIFSALVCVLLIRVGGRFMDYPNERSLHEKPVPKGGGLGILGGITVALFLLPPLTPELYWIVGLSLTLGAFSLLDDLYHISPLWRFLVQGMLAGFLIAQVGWPRTLPLPGGVEWPNLVGMAFGWLFVVWMTNLYNFMDGMDGFAGGMTVIGFGTLALFGWLGGDEVFTLVCASVAAASVGFLLFNFPPARLFMGDVGSASLGFFAAGLLLWGNREGLFPLWAGAMTFLPFIMDATVTLLRRLMRGERVWQAHRSHYYQRLVRQGWGHLRTVLWEYGLMVFCSIMALWAAFVSHHRQWGLLGGVLLIFALIMVWIEFRERAGRNIIDSQS